MSNRDIETAAMGIAAIAAVGTAAYISMKKSPMEIKMKKLKKSTGKALRNMSNIAGDISNFIG